LQVRDVLVGLGELLLEHQVLLLTIEAEAEPAPCPSEAGTVATSVAVVTGTGRDQAAIIRKSWPWGGSDWLSEGRTVGDKSDKGRGNDR
jgi:hypothetical protein